MAALQQLWPAPPLKPTLTADKVHVWRIDLNGPTPDAQDLHNLLASDEKSRADRFRFDKDRQRFVVVRGLLRVILGRYLDQEPSQLRFVYNDYGKPTLAPAPTTRGLSFNLSHAHKLALVAVTRDRLLGIDLEHIRPIPEIERIAERIFSPQEKEIFRAVAVADKLGAFFRYWTCKEACIKARGEGLSLPLDQFQVGPILSGRAPALNVEGNPQESTRWFLRELIPAEGYAAALAVERGGWELTQWHYSH